MNRTRWSALGEVYVAPPVAPSHRSFGLTVGFVLLPFGVISRLFGADPLDRRRRSDSFWIAYSPRVRDPKHYERLF